VEDAAPKDNKVDRRQAQHGAHVDDLYRYTQETRQSCGAESCDPVLSAGDEHVAKDLVMRRQGKRSGMPPNEHPLKREMDGYARDGADRQRDLEGHSEQAVQQCGGCQIHKRNQTTGQCESEHLAQ
jgi:hypothetical protein